MNLTDSQRAASEHRGSSLLVAASAGSGKTEVLARRCVSLIADPQRPCGVDRLLVVTFTRAAAAELRVRVARMLREAAQGAADKALRRHLRRQELLVETADIGTIDSWCGHVVREHFAEAGIDVDFAVLSEQDAFLFRHQVRDTLFDEIHRGTDSAAVAARNWIARAAVPDDAFLRNLVERLNRFRENLVNPESWFAQRREARHDNAEDVLAPALAAECRFQEAQLDTVLSGASDGAGRKVLDLYRDALREWQARLRTPGMIAQVTEDLAAFRIPKPRLSRNEPPEPAVVTQIRTRWLKQRLQETWAPDTVKGMLRHAPACASLVDTLLQLENRYQQMLADAKRQRASYEFGDVLRMTLDLLGTPSAHEQRRPTPIAERLRGRYEHILVDEYQDTSPVQVEILRLVTRSGAGRTNRFMVGDVKQSIYGFRQAEPRLFTALIDAFAGGKADGRVQYLADNFRSHAGLLKPLNEMFALLFDRLLGGTPFTEDERLRAGRQELPNPSLPNRPRVTVEVIEQSRERAAVPAGAEAAALEPELIEREAQRAAERIHALLARRVQVPAYDAQGDLTLRPMRWADCAVLLRSAAHNAGLVARVLRANGIPCVTSGRESLLDALEVADVCNVLRLLVNRRQDVPLAAYLRGPLVGASAAELLKVRQGAAGPCDFYDAVQQYVAGGEDQTLRRSLRTALARLDRWAAATREEEVATLLRRILMEGGLTEFARALPGGEQRVARLRSLQAIAAEFNASGQGVAEFVAYLDALAAAEADPGAPAASSEDAVRIMTIHAAKGLEFPFVFLLGTGVKFNEQSQREPLQTDEELGLGIRFRDYPARAELTSAVHHVVRQRVRQKELGEELRLLYVAATRAREYLLILGHAPDGTWQELQEQFGGTHQAPPLVTRLSVPNRLEWVLMAVAAAELHKSRDGRPPEVQVEVHAAADLPARNLARPAPAAPTDAADETGPDKTWVTRARALLAARPDPTLAGLPAVLSVSTLKELATAENAAEQPHTLDGPPPALREPAFVAAAATTEGRAVGIACHRFLERADFARLLSAEDVRRQLGEQSAARWLAPSEVQHVPVEDIVWLAGSEVGTLLRDGAADLRREMPFVYALPVGIGNEYTIVRGVIDCLIETPTGLIVLDYKTDIVRDEATLAERRRAYTRQLQLYAHAAAQILAQPVMRAVLVFLRLRRTVDVPSDLPAPADLLGRLLSTEADPTGDAPRRAW